MSRSLSIHTVCRDMAILSVFFGICVAPLAMTYKPEASINLLLAIMLQAGIFLTAPYWIKLKWARKYFYWPDALSQSQVNYLNLKRIDLAHKEAKSNGYVSRLKKYVYMTFTVLITLSLLDTLFPLHPAFGLTFTLLGISVYGHYIFVLLVTVPNRIIHLMLYEKSNK